MIVFIAWPVIGMKTYYYLLDTIFTKKGSDKSFHDYDGPIHYYTYVYNILFFCGTSTKQ